VNQGHFVCQVGQRPAGCRYRARLCLLKGCERLFRPRHPQARYCSEACQRAARRWRRRRSSQRYRGSEAGRQRRREQSRRYRQRRERPTSSAEIDSLREGQRPGTASEGFSRRRCERPGCYEHFAIKHEESCRRFCSVACRLALRRVLDRESRYRARRRRWRRQRLSQRRRPPDTS